MVAVDTRGSRRFRWDLEIWFARARLPRKLQPLCANIRKPGASFRVGREKLSCYNFKVSVGR